MSYTLNDAIDQYRNQTEGTHKFWNYFQVVAAGAVAIAWQDKLKIPHHLMVWLFFAFIIFAFASNYAIFQSQKEARGFSVAIKDYCQNNSSQIPKEFLGPLSKVSSMSPFLVSIWHAVLSLATVVAIGARAWL